MSEYIKHTWVDGEVIDAPKLNNIETGIVEAKKAVKQTKEELDKELANLVEKANQDLTINADNAPTTGATSVSGIPIFTIDYSPSDLKKRKDNGGSVEIVRYGRHYKMDDATEQEAKFRCNEVTGTGVDGYYAILDTNKTVTITKTTHKSLLDNTSGGKVGQVPIVKSLNSKGLPASFEFGDLPKEVTLSDATDSTSGANDGVAATPAAVKAAYDLANEAKEAAEDTQDEINNHNTNTEAHADLRLELKNLTDRINAALDSDDTTLDELSEIVAYIKSNKSLIDAITTSKVNVSDIVDNLVTNVTNRPLSAAQGVVLKGLIDTLQTAVNGKAPKSHASTDTTYGAGSGSNYGHVKLSDATNGTSGASGGVAATPAAVKAAYDLANTANTNANGKAPAYSYGTVDLTAGSSALETGKLHFVYE